MPTARRVILWRTKHDPRTFVERLDFVTAAGNVDRVVTPLGVFVRRDGRLEVESLHPGVTPRGVSGGHRVRRRRRTRDAGNAAANG